MTDALRYCPQHGLRLEDAPPVVDDVLGQVLLGQFEVVEAIGDGAMGAVYRAWQTAMARPVAVKMLHRNLATNRDLVARFLREARAAARIGHPNIVTVHVVGEHAGRPYIVMEHVPGTTLEDALIASPRRRLPPMRAVRIARQITSALAEAHAQGIVHRDLKPANVMLVQRRRAADVVKILDFGIAKVLDRSAGAGDSNLTRDGDIIGTPHYIAPEQAASEPVDRRADLYSVGVMLYQMVSGRLPFEGAQLPVLVAHMTQPPPPIDELAPGLDPRLSRIIMRCLHKAPSDRFDSAEALTDALDDVTAERWDRARGAASAGDGAAVDVLGATRPFEPRVAYRSSAGLMVWILLIALGLGSAVAASRAGLLAGSGYAGKRAEIATPVAHVVDAAVESEALPATERRAVLVSGTRASLRALIPERATAGVTQRIELDVWDDDGAPWAGARPTLRVVASDGHVTAARVLPADHPGGFVVEFVPDGPGAYSLLVSAHDAGEVALHLDVAAASPAT